MSFAELRRWRIFQTFASRKWIRRIAFWGGAVGVGVLAVAFAILSDQAGRLQEMIYHRERWAMLAWTPAITAIAVWVALRFFPGSGGSGIPQVIAAIELDDPASVARLLPIRAACGKLALTCFGVLGGLSIGREGPTVQIAATLMAALGRWVKLPAWAEQRALIVAGGAAGIAAAFNTPLAGVVFAIEELSRSFESRTSGMVLTSVILAGITSLALIGNYSYFGTNPADLGFGAGWLCVLVTGIAGGFAGGGFSQILLMATEGKVAAHLARRPVAAAAAIGLAVGAIGLACNGTSFGTGYGTARGLLAAGNHAMPVLSWYFFPAKFTVTILSYLSGIPGGVFAPSLTAGAALGSLLSHLVPGAPPGTVVLLGMAAYFTGVVQAPITSIVIVMEMTNNQQLAMPLMATSLIAQLTSRAICPHPLYAALAERFKAAPSPESAAEPDMLATEVPAEGDSAPI